MVIRKWWSMSIKEVDITSEQRGGRNRRRVRLLNVPAEPTLLEIRNETISVM